MLTEGRPNRAWGFSLVSLLALSAIGELLLGRVALHRLLLLRSDPPAGIEGGRLPAIISALDWLGQLFRNFTAVLALLVAVAGSWVIVCGRQGYSRVWRLALAVASGTFLALVAADLIGPLRGRPALWLGPAAALTVLTLLGSSLTDTRISRRQRLGLMIVAGPVLLQLGVAAVVALSTVGAPLAALAFWTAGLPIVVATALVVAQALAVLPLFAWRPRRARGLVPGAVSLALLPALVLMVLLFQRFGLVAQAAYEGLGIVLPLGEGGNPRLLTLYACAAWLLLVGFASLLRDGPGGRATAAGLALVLVAGARWHGPLPALLGIVGLLQLAACGRRGNEVPAGAAAPPAEP